MSNNRISTILEWTGAGFAFSGTVMLSLGIMWGWLTFTISNPLLIVASCQKGMYGVLVLNIGFLIFNIIGIWRYLL